LGRCGLRYRSVTRVGELIGLRQASTSGNVFKGRFAVLRKASIPAGRQASTSGNVFKGRFAVLRKASIPAGRFSLPGCEATRNLLV